MKRKRSKGSASLPRRLPVLHSSGWQKIPGAEIKTAGKTTECSVEVRKYPVAEEAWRDATWVIHPKGIIQRIATWHSSTPKPKRAAKKT